MKEEIFINGKKVWILIEPHAQEHATDDQPAEYFTASYDTEAAEAAPGGVLLVDEDNAPKRFASPVEALEFANEKLLGLL